jgi:phosphatidylglycerol:prolipoprotein diacylglycerol transferase
MGALPSVAAKPNEPLQQHPVMRQTLFKINLHDLWSLQPIDGIAAVGAGYFLLVLLAIWGGIALVEWRRERGDGMSLLWKLIGPAVITAAVVGLSQRTPEILMKGIPVYGYGAMVFLGFAFGAWSALRRARSVGIDPEVIWDLLTWFFIAGIGGARIFYLIQKRDEVFTNVHGLGEFVFKVVNLTDGGLVLLGGVTAVVIATLIFCHLRKIRTMLLADVLVPSFFIGLGFGRIGCLLNGCCFGDRCELPWAIHFPAQSAAWNALVSRGFLGPEAATTFGLQPTQIYSSIAAFLLAGLTAAYFRRRPFNGAVLVVGLLLEATKRFVIVFLRGDEMGQFGTIFTISQLISMGIFAGGLLLLGWLIYEAEIKAALQKVLALIGVGKTPQSPVRSRT